MWICGAELDTRSEVRFDEPKGTVGPARDAELASDLQRVAASPAWLLLFARRRLTAGTETNGTAVEKPAGRVRARAGRDNSLLSRVLSRASPPSRADDGEDGKARVHWAFRYAPERTRTSTSYSL